MAIIILACGPCVVIVNLLGQVCTLGIALRTKETLPNFSEWCPVTRHPRVFRRLAGCQRTPRIWGVIINVFFLLQSIRFPIEVFYDNLKY